MHGQLAYTRFQPPLVIRAKPYHHFQGSIGPLQVMNGELSIKSGDE